MRASTWVDVMGHGDFECGWCAEDLGPLRALPVRHVDARDLKLPPPAKARQRTAF